MKRKADDLNGDSANGHGSEGSSSNGVGMKKKQILINAFDMSTVGHLSPGQWRNPKDQSANKRKLDYWINLAKLLERGDINALFLADTTGGHDTYEGKLDNCIRRAAQWPVTDPSIPISAMAAVTKNLSFAITASTSFETPFLLAKRFSTLDHMTGGRFGWNIVTSYKKAAFKTIGLDAPYEHDERYEIADEYLNLMYKLWEGSWADDAVKADAENDVYIEPERTRQINHHGKYYDLEAHHIVDPSPQRTPFLFQAGTSSAGINFASKHAEAVFVQAHTPKDLKGKVEKIRKAAQDQGRDPRSIKVFVTLTTIIGRTMEEAKAKHEEYKKYASTVGGLVLFSGWTGIDISKIPIDEPIRAEHSTAEGKISSMVSGLTQGTAEVPTWTPRKVSERASIGGLSPLAVGTPQSVADEIEKWVDVADIDGFNMAYATSPGTFEDIVDLLIPELRRRGLYPEKNVEGLTLRERVYGPGQSGLRDDHPGSKYQYDVYEEEAPAAKKQKLVQGLEERVDKAPLTH